MGEVRGVIHPEAAYDTDAVMEHAGIGEVKLMEERKAGRIAPKKYNGRNWYLGRDVIALICDAARPPVAMQKRSAPNTTRKHTRVVGRLDPQALYTKEGCLKFGGIGRNQLIEAKRSGMVKAIPCGKRVYFEGAELIAWIKSHRSA